MTTIASVPLALSQDCVSTAFELVVIQQPSGNRDQHGSSVLEPFPVCHLRPRMASRSVHQLHPYLLLQCHIESIPARSPTGSSQGQSSQRTNLPATLKGQTVVGPRSIQSGPSLHASSSTTTLTDYVRPGSGGMEEAWFAFRDLGVEGAGGEYRLRFTLIETVGSNPHVCAKVWSQRFRLSLNDPIHVSTRSSDLCAELTDLTTTLPLHLSSPREYRVPMIRRRYQPQRSTASKPGLPELPGLASAIYRPEPRSRARILHGKGSASVASTSRRSGTGDEQRSKEYTEDGRTGNEEIRGTHSHSLSASSSLPSLSVLFPPPADSPSQPRSSGLGSSSHHYHTFGSSNAPTVYEHGRSSHSKTARAQARRSDSLRNTDLPPPTSSGTLVKKQSAPARLITARIKPGTGHQVGNSTSREVATRRGNSRERGSILPAIIKSRLSRQSSPARSTVNLEDEDDIEMLTEESWTRSPRWNETKSRHDFRSPRTSPSPSGIKRGLPWPISRLEDRPHSSHRTTSPQEVSGSHHSSSAKMGISNLLS